MVQLEQIGASQVPLRRVGTFQSHSSVPGLPHRQRFALPVQTIAEVPSGSLT